MRILVVLLLFSVSRGLAALEIYKTNDLAAKVSWSLLRKESGKWVLEDIGSDNDGWPTLVKRLHFHNEREARAAMSGRRQNMAPTRGLPQTETELLTGSGDSLWPVTQSWSWEWELKYSDWVKTELDRTWWSKHKLATDCADVAYSARWIFARIHGLPMANRLGSGHWFTHRSVKPQWKKLPTAKNWHEDKRFLAALNYMLDFVFTHTLWQDSYPVEITPTQMIPGVHHLDLFGSTGHTQLIYKVGLEPDEIPVLTLASTIPRAVRDMHESMFFGDVGPGTAGFLRMRWPETSAAGKPGLKAPRAMPGYSEAQFAEDFIKAPRTKFWQEVFFRLNPSLDYELAAHRSATEVAQLFRNRIRIVEDGFRACSQNRCPKGSALYETWSTPHRDSRIEGAINVLRSFYMNLEHPEVLLPQLEEVILAQEGYEFSLSDLILSWNRMLFSSEPGDEPVKRWGIHPRGIALTMEDVFERGLKERDNDVTKSHGCHDLSCEFGSDRYARASSFSSDNALWSKSDFVADYCRAFDSLLCLDLRTRLAGISLAADGRTQSLTRWMEDATYFNSDPRQSRSRRYHSFSKEVPHLMFDVEAARGFSSYDGRAILVDDVHMSHKLTHHRHLHILRRGEFERWSPPVGETLEALDPLEGITWTSQGSELIARHLESRLWTGFRLVTAPTSVKAFGGRALVQDGARLRLFRLEALRLHEEAAFDLLAHNDYDAEVSIAQVTRPDRVVLIDLRTGSVRDLPEYGQMASIERDGENFLVRYSRSSGDGVSCAVVKPTVVVHLNAEGDCLGALPGGHAAFVLGDSFVSRRYRDWALIAEQSHGTYEDMSAKVVNVDQNGTRTAYCLNERGVVEIPGRSLKEPFIACNNRFAIKYGESPKVWQAVDIQTGQIKVRSSGWLSFASNDRREHMVFTMRTPEGEIALRDLDRPESFSLLTDSRLFPTPLRFDRAQGLLVIKNGRQVWMRLPL